MSYMKTMLVSVLGWEIKRLALDKLRLIVLDLSDIWVEISSRELDIQV